MSAPCRVPSPETSTRPCSVYIFYSSSVRNVSCFRSIRGHADAGSLPRRLNFVLQSLQTSQPSSRHHRCVSPYRTVRLDDLINTTDCSTQHSLIYLEVCSHRNSFTPRVITADPLLSPDASRTLECMRRCPSLARSFIALHISTHFEYDYYAQCHLWGRISSLSSPIRPRERLSVCNLIRARGQQSPGGLNVKCCKCAW